MRKKCIFVKEKHKDMKARFALIYIAAGIAFLAVSVWLFLSGGKSVKATRAKFRLGGIMLTAWSMLSFASCEGVPPMVTCYEPVVECYDVAIETDIIHVEVKDYGGRKLKPGDVMVITINEPSYQDYHFFIHSGDSQAPVIQEFNCQVPEQCAGSYSFEQVLGPTDFRGAAMISVIATAINGNGEEIARVVSENSIYLEIVG